MISQRPDGNKSPRPRFSGLQLADTLSPATPHSDVDSTDVPRFPCSGFARSVRNTEAMPSYNWAERWQVPDPSVPSKFSSDDLGSSWLSNYSSPSLNERLYFSTTPWTTSKSTQPSASSPKGYFILPSKIEFHPSNNDRPPNVIRRKAPIIGQYNRGGLEREVSGSERLGQTIPSADSEGKPAGSQRDTQRNPQETNEPRSSPMHRRVFQSKTAGDPTSPEELSSLRMTTADTKNLPPPPEPLNISTSSFSTRYSTSPMIWSRTSTPTTISSYSPGIVSPANANRCSKQPIFLRPELPVFSTTQANVQDQDLQKVDDSLVPSNTPLSIESGGRRPSDHARLSERPNLLGFPSPLKSTLDLGSPDEAKLCTDSFGKHRRNTERQLLDPFEKEFTEEEGISGDRAYPRPDRQLMNLWETHRMPIFRSSSASPESRGRQRRAFTESFCTDNKPHSTRGRGSLSVGSSYRNRLSRTPSRKVTTLGPPPEIVPSHRESEKKREVKRSGRKRFNLFKGKSQAYMRGTIFKKTEADQVGGRSTESLISSSMTPGDLSNEKRQEEGCSTKGSAAHILSPASASHTATNARMYGLNLATTKSYNTINSYNSSNASLPHMNLTRHDPSPREMKLTRSSSEDGHMLKQKRKISKLNVFQESHDTKRNGSSSLAPAQPATGLQDTISPVSVKGRVAHAALADSVPPVSQGILRVEDLLPSQVDETSQLTEVPARSGPSDSSELVERMHLKMEDADEHLHGRLTTQTDEYADFIHGMDISQLDDTPLSAQADQQSFPMFRGNAEPQASGKSTSLDLAGRVCEDVHAQANIRSGSLMTSRWLSFGRVLFSPAHKHVTSKKRERILIIDGLGNDDWSYYCALTYPSAEIFSLSVVPFSSRFSRPLSWQSLSNHRTIRQPNLESQFVFPSGYFAAAVLRLPASCSEKAQDNVISECKRVLRPGGYLEMSLLDLDMVNMGIRTRRAVRRLKERISITNANISLKPVSDNIQRLLGTHGFDNLRRCTVKLPVAGTIGGSADSSSSSDHSAVTPAFTTKNPSTTLSHSLGDLLSDPSPSPSNDESIAKIVAKVGRWWYSQCHESTILPPSPPFPPSQNGSCDNSSIWADRKLLRECQRQGTGFKLLVAYAQKPTEVLRRTASV